MHLRAGLFCETLGGPQEPGSLCMSVTEMGGHIRGILDCRNKQKRLETADQAANQDQQNELGDAACSRFLSEN